MSIAKKKESPLPLVVTGEHSKREAGQKIAMGVAHLYSFKNGIGYRMLNLTEKAIAKGKTPRFPWELLFFRKKTHLQNSSARASLIQKIVTDLKLDKKRAQRERVEGILEELITNAIYHAQTLPDGAEKYDRQKAVVLEASERVEICYGQRSSGIFISVTDNGGKLGLGEICRAFSRCYGMQKVPQIESKSGGAGLGLYMIFEEVTHMKIVTKRDRSTTIACWISTSPDTDQNEFSFNFFEEG